MVMQPRAIRRAHARRMKVNFQPCPNPSTHIWKDEFRNPREVILGDERDISSHQRSLYMQRMQYIGQDTQWPSLSVLTPV